MSNIPEKVGEVLREIKETPQTACWDCHGTPVLYHKALEKVAAVKNIRFDPPVIIESSLDDKKAVIQVTGHMGDQTQWSFGEVAQYNNKNTYPFAMAEKRAKDRVILKLVGLSGYVYSEEEADDFNEKQSRINQLLAYNAAVREHFDFVWQVKSAVANEQWEELRAIIEETKNEVKHSLNLATSMGGIFTTEENKAMKVNPKQERR